MTFRDSFQFYKRTVWVTQFLLNARRTMEIHSWSLLIEARFHKRIRRRLVTGTAVPSASSMIRSLRRMPSTWATKKSGTKITSFPKCSTTWKSTIEEGQFPTLTTSAILSTVITTRLFPSRTHMWSLVDRMSYESSLRIGVPFIKMDQTSVSSTAKYGFKACHAVLGMR